MTLRLNLVHLVWDQIAGSTNYEIQLDGVKVAMAGPRAKSTKITIPEGAEHKVTIKALPSEQVQEARFEWASLEQPEPPPPGMALDSLADLNFVWNGGPGGVQPAVFGGWPTANGGGMFYASTPYGDGFEFIANTSMPAPWDSGDKLSMAQGLPPTFYGNNGTTELWQFYLYFPGPQSLPYLPSGWQVGVLWEFHDDASSGHHLCLNTDGTFRIGRQIAPSGAYNFTHTGRVIEWNTWIPVTIDIKWSAGSDGFMRVSIGGTEYLNSPGQTFFSQGLLKTQFGWYSDLQYTNTVRFGGITVVRT